MFGQRYLVKVQDWFGYIDSSGNMAIPPRFDAAWPFHEGLAPVQEDGRWGYIDTEGAWAVPPEFEQAGRFNESYAVVTKDKKQHIIDREGNIVCSPQVDGLLLECTEGLFMIEMYSRSEGASLTGFLDNTGKLVIPPRYEAAGFTEGLAAVYLDEERHRGGYIDKTGELVFGIREGTYFSFKEGLAPYRVGSKNGFIDRDGKTVIKPIYDRVSGFSDGMAAATVGGICWYINPSGDTLFTVSKAEEVRGFAFGLAGFRKQRWGYLNPDGEVAIPPRFHCAGDFQGDLARTVMGYTRKGQAYAEAGYIDRQGDWVWSRTYRLPPGRQRIRSLRLGDFL